MKNCAQCYNQSINQSIISARLYTRLRKGRVTEETIEHQYYKKKNEDNKKMAEYNNKRKQKT